MKSYLEYLVFGILIFTMLSCEENPSVLSDTNSKMENKKSEGYFDEPHRPQYHFSPPANWMNDPNGMVYYEGEYHLFYQYYPDSTVWGPMHWGHAVTSDLTHWEHLPIALYPDSLGYIFSGSAVIDWKNTSGFGVEGKPPMIAIFTHHLIEGERAGRTDFQYQSIAYSLDKGRTWTKYKNNPVIPNTEKIKDFRDPKVIWDEASSQWLMVFAAGDHVMFWGSPNLKDWTHLSDWGKDRGSHAGVWECPDIFPMIVAGTDEVKYVLLLSINPGAPNGGSGTQYFVGNFDGKEFTLDPGFEKEVTNEQGVWLDYGRDNYAGVTWSDVPKEDGRRLFMGWMSNWDYAQVVPTQKWRSAMTLPRTLELVKKENKYRVFSRPVKELDKLRKTTMELSPTTVKDRFSLPTPNGLDLTQCELEFSVSLATSTANEFGLTLKNKKGEAYRFGYRKSSKQFFCERAATLGNLFSPKFAHEKEMVRREKTDPTIKFRMYVDHSSIEMFIDDGEIVLTEIFFPSEPFTEIELFTEGGEAVFGDFKVYGVEGI